jgi:hypothetical protein
LPLRSLSDLGPFLLLAVELFILGLLLRTFLRSLFGLESASLSGAFGPGFFLLLTMTAFVLGGALSMRNSGRS